MDQLTYEEEARFGAGDKIRSPTSSVSDDKHWRKNASFGRAARMGLVIMESLGA